MKSFVLLLFSVALYKLSNGFMIDLPSQKLQNELTIKLKPISAEVKCPMCEFYKFMQTQKWAQKMPMTNITTIEPPKPAAAAVSSVLPKIPVNPAFMAILNKVGAAFKKAIEVKEKFDEKKLEQKFGSIMGTGNNATDTKTTTKT